MRIFVDLRNADAVRIDNGVTGIIRDWNMESINNLADAVARGVKYLATYRDVSRWIVTKSCEAAAVMTFERLITDEVRLTVQAYAANADRSKHGKKARNTPIVVEDVSDADAVGAAVGRALRRDKLCMEAVCGNKWSAFNSESFTDDLMQHSGGEFCEYWSLADLDTSTVDAERLTDGRKAIEWYVVEAVKKWTADGSVTVKDDAYEVSKPVDDEHAAAGRAVKCALYSIHEHDGGDFVGSVSIPGYGVVMVSAHDGMLSICPANAAADRKRFGEMTRNQAFTFSVDYFVAVDVVTRQTIMEVVLLRDRLCSQALAAADVVDLPSDTDDTADTADATDDIAHAETVVVEPVEVEHDGVVDVEMVETAEIPAVTAETPTAGAVSDDYRQYVGMWASADGTRAWVGADGAVWVHFDHPDDDYESWVRQELPDGVAHAIGSAGAANEWKHLSAEPADDVPRYVTDSGAAKPGTVCADDFERGWRYDGLGAVTRDYAAIPAPRAVQSSPALPAECEAVTTVIPEVPPTPNADAHVLAVSEHVIPTGQSVTDAFGVAYRAVHYVRRVVKRRDGTTTKKKVAAVFRLGDTVHVVRRDRYESVGRDAAVEAEIAARVARLQRAA